jgi:hypothetical protein
LDGGSIGVVCSRLWKLTFRADAVALNLDGLTDVDWDQTVLRFTPTFDLAEHCDAACGGGARGKRRCPGLARGITAQFRAIDGR